MTGTPVTGLTNISGNTLTVHGLFTGSIQGIQTTEQSTKLVFPNADGSAGANCATYSTNSPTIGFPMRPALPLPTRQRATSLKNKCVFSLSLWSNQRPPLAQ